MSHDNNETAFPIIHPDGMGVQYYGMTLRDYFAAKAMQGICSHPDTWGLPTAGAIAEQAYLVADAMLKTRGE